MRLPAVRSPAVRPAPTRRPPISQLRACAVPRQQSTVRVVVPNSDLLCASAEAKQQQQKGIRSVSIGSMSIEFSHDMTNSFRFGGIILALVLIKIFRMGKSAFIDEPNYKHIARSDAEEAELHEFVCENCGYTMFPARGREGKFFPKNFKCPNCDAPVEAFYDMTDLCAGRRRTARNALRPPHIAPT